MTEHNLQGRHILIVEDEYLLANDVSEALQEAGAHVLGPVATIEDATALIAGEARIDGAVLDVNLRGDMVFPVADALTERGVPFLFATGYDRWILPDRFADAPRLEKPVEVNTLAQLLGPMTSSG